MRLVISRLIACAFATTPVGIPRILVAQAPAPLAPTAANGQTATPAFEGWYRNPDGTYSISFGYYNRNTTEVLSMPIGPTTSSVREIRIRVSHAFSIPGETGAYSP